MGYFGFLVLACALIGIKASPNPLDEFAFVLESDDNQISFLNDELSLHRLPNTTKPLHYNVLVAPDFSQAPTSFPYSGTVSISIVATQENVNQIYLSANDLNILTVLVTYNTNIVITTWELDQTYGFLIITLSAGTLIYSANEDQAYTITINFEAQMRNDMYGIYRSWYNEDGQTRWMASTQFQATSARAAFPCYDEPKYKATFDFTIRRPQTYRSWFNMRLANTANVIAGTVDDIYHTTPIMSTYLLALIVAQYESISTTNAQNELVYEVIARRDAIQTGQGQYSFDVGQALLAEMDAHTGIDYYSHDPNIKLTQASIPDFSAGAMENWGLITYREAYLMYDEQHTNSYFKQLIAYILSHEIAHMWFGNLVTCEWWDVLWLNEGFARYYQYFLTHWVEDYMGLDVRFINEQVHTALLSDSVENAHPLTDPSVDDPATVSAHFSTLTYNKGAAIIRQTEHLLGFDVHQQGLQNYLTSRAYDTARPIDLFQALQNVAEANNVISEYGSSFNIIDYYNSWTEQAGHPILDVYVNHQNGDMIIQQRRFGLTGGYSSIASNYIIPITFATASNPDFADTKPSHILSNTLTIINKGSSGQEWVIFNKQQTGFYRVNYDDYTWGLITQALRGADRTLIHEFNRAQIVNDVFTFARAGLMSYTKAFNILSFLENETEYAPWVAAMTGFTWLRNQFAGSSQLANLNAMIAQWSNNIMNQIGYNVVPGETFMRSYLRYQLAPVMCNIGVVACRTAATAQFAALRDLQTEVAVDNRNWVYCNALRDGTTADFDFLWNRYLNHNVYTEKILILMTIGCTPHATSLNTLLQAIMEDNYLIRPQDYSTAYSTAVTGNEQNTQIVFQWIQNNFPLVQNAFANVASPLSSISARLRTEAEIVAFETWANANAALLGNSYNAVINGVQTSRNIIAWANTYSSDVSEFFVNGYQEMQLTTIPPFVEQQIPTVLPPILEVPIIPDFSDSGAIHLFSSFLTTIAAVCVLYVNY